MASLSPEQEWTLVACGLVAHADEVLEVGEWEHVLRMVDGRIDAEEMDRVLAMLVDRGALEARFAELAPPLPAFAETVLRQCWHMALADGHISEFEAAIHDRIAERVGIDADTASRLREGWTLAAATRAEIVVGFAAALANLDGRMDTEEAVQFDALLGRMPLSLGRRAELSVLLYDPPVVEELARRAVALHADEREMLLHDLAPIVLASHRGERERAVYFELAERAAVARHRAELILREG
jgi:tellurite resistance protein